MSISDLDEKDNMKLVIEESDNESEPEQIEKTVLSECDIYYKFRYTFDDNCEDNNSRKTVVDLLLSKLKRFILNGKFVAGIENFKSGMEAAKPHVHIHFVSRTKKDTIVKHLKRSCKKDQDDGYGNMFHGNRCYSLGVEINVNENKFFRYPLKQQKDETHRMVKYGEYFSKERIITLRDEAYAVWITSCEIQNAKKEKKEDNDCLSERLYFYLDKLDNLDNDLKIKVAIQKFYIEEEKKPFNKTTALGYFYNYKIMRGRMTHEQLAFLW